MARNQNQQGGSNMPREVAKPANLTHPEIAIEYGIDKPLWNALRNLYPGAQDASIVMVYEYCQVRKLDPLKKPVHIVPMSVKDALTDRYEMRDVIMPGIQEMRTTAARTSEYAGMDPPVLGPEIEVPLVVGETTVSPQKIIVPMFVTTTVYRLVQGKRYPFTHTEYFAEAVARTRNGVINDMWKKRPIGQLSKCSEAGALRKAFPEELGGEYAAEEMEGREETLVVEALPPEHGASGIPEPETVGEPEAVAAPATEAEVTHTQAPRQEAGEDDDATGLVDPAAAKAAAERVAAREQAAEQAAKAPAKKTPAKKAAPAKPAEPKQEPAPAATSFKVDLPAGAHGVLKAEMAKRNVEEGQLLAKVGGDITIGNINQALGILKAWS